jgi:penicillin-binding protein-related factor A (putative recombinase)
VSHANRGKALEGAVRRAAVAYRKADPKSCLLIQQHPRVAMINGFMREVGTAPADFLGAIAGKPAAVECKETEEPSWPLSKMDGAQLDALSVMHAAGFDVRLVIDFKVMFEVYSIAWQWFADFVAAPWRKSLSLTWCRAYGELVPQDDREKPDHRRVRFLDGRPHVQLATCLEAITLERQTLPVVSLDPPDIVGTAHVPSLPRTKEEREAATLAAVNEGVGRQLELAKRGGRTPRKWGTP